MTLPAEREASDVRNLRAVPLFPRKIFFPGFCMIPPVPVTVISVSSIRITAPRDRRASIRWFVSSDIRAPRRRDSPSASEAIMRALWV